jgi:hypothetical protein
MTTNVQTKFVPRPDYEDLRDTPPVYHETYHDISTALDLLADLGRDAAWAIVQSTGSGQGDGRSVDQFPICILTGYREYGVCDLQEVYRAVEALGPQGESSLIKVRRVLYRGNDEYERAKRAWQEEADAYQAELRADPKKQAAHDWARALKMRVNRLTAELKTAKAELHAALHPGEPYGPYRDDEPESVPF